MRSVEKLRLPPQAIAARTYLIVLQLVRHIGDLQRHEAEAEECIEVQQDLERQMRRNLLDAQASSFHRNSTTAEAPLNSWTLLHRRRLLISRGRPAS
eukprot:scaffold5937_cov275-Pinguiococcus_pyrenoidosus.AAC.7